MSDCHDCGNLKIEIYYLTREIKKLKAIIEEYKHTGVIHIWEDS